MMALKMCQMSKETERNFASEMKKNMILVHDRAHGGGVQAPAEAVPLKLPTNHSARHNKQNCNNKQTTLAPLPA
jgi:hypothetical protein